MSSLMPRRVASQVRQARTSFSTSTGISSTSDSGVARSRLDQPKALLAPTMPWAASMRPDTLMPQLRRRSGCSVTRRAACSLISAPSRRGFRSSGGSMTSVTARHWWAKSIRQTRRLRGSTWQPRENMPSGAVHRFTALRPRPALSITLTSFTSPSAFSAVTKRVTLAEDISVSRASSVRDTGWQRSSVVIMRSMLWRLMYAWSNVRSCFMPYCHLSGCYKMIIAR